MVKIKNLNDFEKLKNTNYLIRDYLFNHIFELFKTYECTNLSSVGAFYLLENKEDVANHNEFGLSLPLDKAVAEFTQLITIKDNINEVTLLYSCFVITNDYAISVFTEPKNLTDEMQLNLLWDHTEKEVQINVQER